MASGNPSLQKNAALKMLLNIFNIVIPLIVGPYLARLLDPTLYGDYNNALSQLNVVLPIAGFGVYNYGIRYISRVRDDKAKVESLFTQLFFIGLVTNVIGFVLFLAYAVVLHETNGASLAIYAALSIQILANIFLTEWMNEAYETYGFIMVKTVIFRLLYVAGIFALVRQPDDVAMYALLLSISALFNNLASFIYIKRRARFRFPITRRDCKPVVKSLCYLVLITNANILYTQLDRLFLSGFATDSIQATYYAMPQTILYTVLNVVNAIVLVTIARLSYYLSNDQQDNYLDLLQRSSQTFFMLLFPISVGMAATSEFVMTLYGGAQYTAAAPVLFVFALRTLVTCFQTVLSQQVIYLYGRENTLMKIALAGGCINLLLNSGLVLCGWMTPATLVLTTLIADVVVTVLEVIVVRSLNPRVHVFRLRNLKYLLLSFSFFPISWLIGRLPLSFFAGGAVTIVICVIVYFGVLLLIRDQLFISFLRSLLARVRRS